MKVVIDIECDALVNPKHIWLIVCKELESGTFHIFRNVTEEEKERERFRRYFEGLRQPDSVLIGHNLLGYDGPVLDTLLGLRAEDGGILYLDTLILSKLIDYSRKGHSIEDYGEEFNKPKGKFVDFSQYSKEMEDYCVRDVEICELIYRKYHKYISNSEHHRSIALEHEFQGVVNQLHSNGFAFNTERARKLLEKVEADLAVLDKDILEAFPPKLRLIREITPKETKYGTLSKTDFRWLEAAGGDLSDFNGGPFCRCSWVHFNPASHKQIIEVLSSAGWSPLEKTQSHIDTERELQRLKYNNRRDTALDIRKKELILRLQELEKTGWKVNEANLETLPATAPVAARLLAKRILLESRRRTLTEWLSLVSPEGRIHGKFYGIGAWTHRMAHQAPNTANIPKEFDTNGKKKLLGKELRSLWRAPKNRLLVGVDAEGIQLRIFAHLINDPILINALVNGKKEDKSDPHSHNQRILGSACKTRDAAKRFLYALFLGAGLAKLAAILDCSQSEAREALERLITQYQGWSILKDKTIPRDAERGWFVGISGGRVAIPGDTVGQRKHLAMSGYLQHGEQVVVKSTVLRTLKRMQDEGYEGLLVNIVHDEVVIEVPNDVRRAEYVSNIFCEEIEAVGKDLKLNCPLAGDGHVGLNWYEIH